MSRNLFRTLACLGAVILALGFHGCSKRVPLADGVFEAQQRIMLTLKDGRTIEGKIGPGQKVEYRDGDSVYRARVASVSAEVIQLDDLILLDQANSYSMVSQRLADAKTRITEPAAPVTVPRAEIEKVEELRFDTALSARRTSFWLYGGAIFVMLLGERS